MKKHFYLLLILFSTQAFARGDTVAALEITGELKVQRPDILPLKEGVFSLFSAEYCGFLKCNNRRLIFKSDDEKFEIPISKKDFLPLRSFSTDQDSMTLTSADAKLKASFKTKHGVKKTFFEFREVPPRCESICIAESTDCKIGGKNEWGECDIIGVEVTTCDKYETRCDPAYEACFNVTETVAHFELVLSEAKSKEVVATLNSNDRKHRSETKVKMANCFQ